MYWQTGADTIARTYLYITHAYACYIPRYLRSRLRYHAYDVPPPLSRRSIISSALCAAPPRYMARVLRTRTNVLARHGGSKFSRIADWIPLEFIKAYYEGLAGQGDPSTLTPEVMMIVPEISTLNHRTRGMIGFGLFLAAERGERDFVA